MYGQTMAGVVFVEIRQVEGPVGEGMGDTGEC